MLAHDVDGIVASVEVSINNGSRYHPACRAINDSNLSGNNEKEDNQCTIVDTSGTVECAGALGRTTVSAKERWQREASKDATYCRVAELVNAGSPGQPSLWRFNWRPDFPMNDAGNCGLISVCLTFVGNMCRLCCSLVS